MVWGLEVITWAYDPKRRDMFPFVKRMRGVERLAGALPPNLTHLTFGYVFTQPLEVGVLPANLTQLTFGDDFNQPLEAGVLPHNLTHLTFGRVFKQPLAADVIPTGCRVY